LGRLVAHNTQLRLTEPRTIRLFTVRVLYTPSAMNSPSRIEGDLREVAIQKVRGNRQIVAAVGSHDMKTPLAASANAVLLHQLSHTLLAYTNALRMP
jgi:hypothetical protein